MGFTWKNGGFTIANVDPSGRDDVDLLDQRTADMLVVLGVSENGGATPGEYSPKGFKRIFQETLERVILG